MTAPSHVEVLEEFIETMDRLVDDFYKYQDGDTRVPFSVIRDSIVSALTEYQEVRSAIALMRAPVGDAVTGRVNGYMLRARAIEILTDGEIPEWLTNAPSIRVAVAAMQQAAGGGE